MLTRPVVRIRTTRCYTCPATRPILPATLVELVVMGHIPKKSLGQNFLTRASAIHRILDTLDHSRGTPRVVEIGPGRGALTAPLIERVGTIAAVETDPQLASDLQERFGDRLQLVQGDILEQSIDGLFEPLPSGNGLRHIVGNLPYNISKPIVMLLVEACQTVDRAILMFQQEVADRLLAQPGSKSYGPLSILVGQFFEVRKVLGLPPEAFRPRPKVHSTVVQWTRREPSALDDPLDRARLRRCLRSCFAQRRKTLRNNLLAAGWSADQISTSLSEFDLKGDERAETLPPEFYVALAERWPTL